MTHFNTSGEITMDVENSVDATLNAWQAQLDQVRRRRLERGGGHAGLADPKQIQGMTGLPSFRQRRSSKPTTHWVRCMEAGTRLCWTSHWDVPFKPRCRPIEAIQPARSISTLFGQQTQKRVHCVASVQPFMSAGRSARLKQG